MNKNTSLIKTIVDIGLFSALGFVFDELQSILSKGIFVNGGSIGFAMIVLVIIGVRRGIIPALVTGLIMGLLDVATGPYVLSFAQVLLDYVFPYFFAALALLLLPLYKTAKDNKHKLFALMFITLVAGILKFFSHYLAGILYWADPSGFAWNLTNINPYLYCFVYNFAFIGPSIVLCQLLLLVLYKRVHGLFIIKETESKSLTQKKKDEFFYYIVWMIFGTFLLVFFLIKYIQSLYSEYDGWGTDISLDPNYLVSFLSGAIIIIICVSTIIKQVKFDKDVNRLTALQFVIVGIINIIFALARIIKASKKGGDAEFNRIQIYISFLIGFIAVYYYLYHFKKREIKTRN